MSEQKGVFLRSIQFNQDNRMHQYDRNFGIRNKQGHFERRFVCRTFHDILQGVNIFAIVADIQAKENFQFLAYHVSSTKTQSQGTNAPFIHFSCSCRHLRLFDFLC
jgi:hypothetical protein